MLERLRHIDIDIDKFDAGLCAFVAGSGKPSTALSLNIRYFIKIKAAPRTATGEPFRARATELEDEYGFLPKLFIAHDVRASLAVVAPI